MNDQKTGAHFFGLPCINCKASLRYHSNRGCVACQLKRSKIQSATQSSKPNRKTTNYRYNHSSKGVAARAKYKSSPKGKLTQKLLKQTPEIRKKDKLYRQTPIGKASTRASQLRNKLRRKNIPGFHSGTEWLALKEQYGNRCLCCGRPESIVRLERDHIIPITRPGSTNWIDNIQPLCRDCNQRKLVSETDYRLITTS
jgi:5-methylcytosine-specific restriction endonuclease McrA